jgi:hypothetical protein
VLYQPLGGKWPARHICRCSHVQEANEEKQAAVAKTLGISDSEADSLRQVVSSGSWRVEEEAADAGSFF